MRNVRANRWKRRRVAQYPHNGLWKFVILRKDQEDQKAKIVGDAERACRVLLDLSESGPLGFIWKNSSNNARSRKRMTRRTKRPREVEERMSARLVPWTMTSPRGGQRSPLYLGWSSPGFHLSLFPSSTPSLALCDSFSSSYHHNRLDRRQTHLSFHPHTHFNDNVHPIHRCRACRSSVRRPV